ncbi:MAG: ATP-binding protein [Epsilonproteobacteria bacterium]|nr:ATP-binding protein [Campylobacterota bacterium]
MFKRDLEKILLEYTKFPVVAILGPRQSGKTTLAQATFNNYTYVSLEDLKTRELALEDPQNFLAMHENEHGIIIDEFQNVPDILSQIQIIVDQKKRPGYFVLTGSQNFLMNQAISQSLAGRVGILTLLPLSLHELNSNNLLTPDVNQTIINGFYPRIYDESFSPSQLYPSYIQTYVQRDVRQLSHVGDLNAFIKFIKLCAGRIGQILNMSEIAGVCGISTPTAQRWLSILQASYIIFLLQPYFNNFNKRQTSAPKLYFFDTGIACSLLDITSADRLGVDRLYGNMFENFIIADLYKQYYTVGKQPPVYFWRDKNGRLEVDCIIEEERTIFPVEIKSGKTIASDFFTNLKEWSQLAQKNNLDLGTNFIVYGGQQSRTWDNWATIGYQDAGVLLEKYLKPTSNE